MVSTLPGFCDICRWVVGSGWRVSVGAAPVVLLGVAPGTRVYSLVLPTSLFPPLLGGQDGNVLHVMAQAWGFGLGGERVQLVSGLPVAVPKPALAR